jgi:hypothetical protein
MAFSNEEYRDLRVFLLKVINNSADSITDDEIPAARQVLLKLLDTIQHENRE